MSGNSSKERLTAKARRFGFYSPLLFAFSLALVLPSAKPAQASSLISELVRKINRNFEGFPGIKAYLELELSQPGIPPYHSFAQIAFRQQGKQLYFKTFSPLTPHYFTLIAKEGVFWLQIPKAKTIYTGPQKAIGQESFELKITPQDFQKLIFPNPVDHRSKDVRIVDEPGQWVIQLLGHVHTKTFKERELAIQKQSFRVVKEIRYSIDGKPFLEIRWENFGSQAGDFSFPGLITLFKPSTGYLLRLRLKKWEVTDQLPEKLFELAGTEGYRVEKISA